MADPRFTGIGIFDVDNGSTAMLRIFPADANGVRLDSINADGSAFAPLDLRTTQLQINGVAFSPDYKVDSAGGGYFSSDANQVLNTKLGPMADPTTNTPTGSWTQMLSNTSSGNWGYQLAKPWFEENLYFRHLYNASWGSWRKVWHSGNFNADALGWNGLQPSNNDWNNAMNTGWFMASDAANAPTGGWFMGMVHVHNNDWVQQEVWSFTEFPTRRYRRSKLGGGWTGWVRDADVIVSSADPGGPDGNIWIQI